MKLTNFLKIIGISFFILLISGCVLKGEEVIDLSDNHHQEFPSAHYNLNINYNHEGKYLTIYGVDDTSIGNGLSMQPSISNGHYVLLKEYSKEPLQVGALIRYLNPSTVSNYTLHRIVGMTPEYYITKGDYNTKEEIVYEKDITHIALGVLFT